MSNHPCSPREKSFLIAVSLDFYNMLVEPIANILVQISASIFILEMASVLFYIVRLFGKFCFLCCSGFNK